MIRNSRETDCFISLSALVSLRLPFVSVYPVLFVLLTRDLDENVYLSA